MVLCNLSVVCQEWIGAVTCRRDVFLAVAEQHQAAFDKESRKFGECLARLRVCSCLCLRYTHITHNTLIMHFMAVIQDELVSDIHL